MDLEHPIRRADGVAQHLERAILEGRFRPDERLPSERDLATRWGVSRPTVREGIGLLVAKGLLVRRQGDGTYVNNRTDQKMAEIWEDMARRHPDIQGDLIEFRQMLECKTAELAAERFDDHDREAMEKAWAEVDAAYEMDDRHRQIRADLAFHRSIADAAHNPVFSYLLVSLIKLLGEHVKVSIAGLAPDSATARQLRLQHRAMLDAILAGDAAQAARAAGSHMEFVRTRLNDIKPVPGRRARSPS